MTGFLKYNVIAMRISIVIFPCLELTYASYIAFFSKSDDVIQFTLVFRFVKNFSSSRGEKWLVLVLFFNFSFFFVFFFPKFREGNIGSRSHK